MGRKSSRRTRSTCTLRKRGDEMIAKKYWIPAALVAIFVVFLIINFIVPVEWFCDDGTYDCHYHGNCFCGTGFWGWVAMVPFFSGMMLALWLVVFLALLLFDKFKKRKK